MELYLNNNKITDISGFSFLPCLEFINLRTNKISILTLDSKMLVMPNLNRLLISYNDLNSFD